MMTIKHISSPLVLATAVQKLQKKNITLYKCIQAYTSQDDWMPDVTPALWKVVSIEAYPEWIQPTGAHDAYDKDAVVSHNGKHWKNTIDANVYEPGAYGWEEIS